MIISVALVLVWYFQTKQQKNPQEIPINEAITRINDKDFQRSELSSSLRSSSRTLTAIYWVTTIGSDATREMLLKKIDDVNKTTSADNDQNERRGFIERLGLAGPDQRTAFPALDRLFGIHTTANAGRRQ